MLKSGKIPAVYIKPIKASSYNLLKTTAQVVWFNAYILPLDSKKSRRAVMAEKTKYNL